MSKHEMMSGMPDLAEVDLSIDLLDILLELLHLIEVFL
jgi:hypothetical protein